MATRLKPTRLNVDNIPEVGDGASYQNDNDFHWSEGGGDMSYEDFEWVTLTGNSLVIEKISNNVTPTGNFTVSTGTLRPGIEYVLRVNTGNTPYTMTLGTGVTNPNGYSTELAPNKVNQFKFIATSDSQLELEGVDTSDFVTLGTQQTITAKKTFNVEPELGTAKTTDATNNGTKFATEAQVYKKADDNKVVHNTGNETVAGTKTFSTSPVVPSKTTDATNTGTAIATEAQVYKKANKVASATADNLASLTSAGDIADSGIAKGTVELNTNKETGDAPTDSTSKYPSSHTVKKYVDDQVAAATAGAVSDTAYDATTWDGVTGIAPSKNAVRDKIVTMDSAISGNTSNISTINGKIPSEASTSNQLADKAYVGDSINSVTAFYITKNAAGDQFATYAELAAATTFYSGGVVRVPTMNDYTIVLDDENHDHATTRYIYNSGWEYQYTINETPLTQAQLNALNSGITAAKVATYDGYATSKQDTINDLTTIRNGAAAGATAIQPGDNVSDLNNDAGFITGITSGDVTNALGYNPANDSSVVHKTGAETISGEKTFNSNVNYGHTQTYRDANGGVSGYAYGVYQWGDHMQYTLRNAADNSFINIAFELTPNEMVVGKTLVVPNKTTDATNNGELVATEAQVYKKQDALVSGTNIKTINNTSLLGSGNIDIQTGGNYTEGNGIDITNNEIGLDGTYEGIGKGKDYSAMQGPAPSGFHVPLQTEWSDLRYILRSGFGLTENATTFGTYLKMPMAGRRDMDDSDPELVGSKGCYWSSHGHSDTNASIFEFSSSSYGGSGSGRRRGLSVRCFKDSPVVPTSSWTTLYNGSSVASGAGVFWNRTDGLISLSSNGTKWYTIMDKNLGATTVYNQGDTLTDANCGYFYQRGNNYGFPHSGTVTTSTTPVDASNYGPGNYYNSSTFITRGPAFDWSSVLNNNLWGGVTGVQPIIISGNLVVGDKLYKIITSTTAPASGTTNDIITIVTD